MTTMFKPGTRARYDGKVFDANDPRCPGAAILVMDNPRRSEIRHHVQTEFWIVDSLMLTIEGPFITYAGHDKPLPGATYSRFHALNLSSLREQYPSQVWQAACVVVDRARETGDPGHLIDVQAPCWGCGGTWDIDGRTMNHAEACHYLRQGVNDHV
jgi:hypothetical protein